MSIWLALLVGPFLASALVLLTVLAGVPAPVAALALVPLVAAGALVWLGLAFGVEVAVLATMLTLGLLFVVPARRRAPRVS